LEKLPVFLTSFLHLLITFLPIGRKENWSDRWIRTVGDGDTVVPGRQSVGEGPDALQDSVELLKVGECRLPHPHDQVLVDEAVVVGVARVQLVYRVLPVGRLGRACGGAVLIRHVRLVPDVWMRSDHSAICPGAEKVEVCFFWYLQRPWPGSGSPGAGCGT